MTAAAGKRVAYRTCPLCEATCGLEIELRGRARHQRPRRRRGRLQRRLHLPEGRQPRAAARRPRPAARARSCAATASSSRRHLGRGVRRDRGELSAPILDATAPRRRRRLRRQPERAQPRRRPATCARCSKALGTPQHLHRLARSTRCRSRSRGALMFGAGLADRGPDVDRTDYLLILGANPARVERLPADRARLPAAAAGDPRRAAARVVVVDPRRTRTAEARRRAPSIRPGTRRAPARRARPHAVRRGPRPTRASSRAARRRPRRGRRRAARAFTARGGRAGAAASTRPTIRRHRPRARDAADAPPSTAGSARRTQALRHARRAGSSTCSTCSPATSTGPAARCSRRRAAASRTPAASPDAGRGSRSAAGTRRVRGAPEVLGELPRRVLAEEIETPGEGQVRALVTVAGNPVLVDAERRAARRARSTRSTFMVSVDLLPERDDAARRRDPAAAARRSSARTTTSPSTRSPSATSPTTRRRCSTAARRDARRVARRSSGWPRSSPGRGAGADVDAVDDARSLSRSCAGATGDPARASPAATRTSCSRALAGDAAPRADRST